MTIEELIDALSDFPADSEVRMVVDYASGRDYPISGVEPGDNVDIPVLLPDFASREG